MENVIISFVFVTLTDDSSLFQKISNTPAANQTTEFVELQLDELSKSRTIVVPASLGITKAL